MKDFAHFEDLWNHGETLLSSGKTETKNDICDDIIRLALDLKNVNRENLTSELFHTLASKKVGEILFRLCKVCLIENINSFEVLMNEVKNFEIENLVNKYKN